jgi:hypothetical protein
MECQRFVVDLSRRRMSGLRIVSASSERCITLHTVPIVTPGVFFNRQPQCLMHEASTLADVTHLKRGSEKAPIDEDGHILRSIAEIIGDRNSRRDDGSFRHNS